MSIRGWLGVTPRVVLWHNRIRRLVFGFVPRLRFPLLTALSAIKVEPARCVPLSYLFGSVFLGVIRDGSDPGAKE
jgi:hypothetical protein